MLSVATKLKPIEWEKSSPAKFSPFPQTILTLNIWSNEVTLRTLFGNVSECKRHLLLACQPTLVWKRSIRSRDVEVAPRHLGTGRITNPTIHPGLLRLRKLYPDYPRVCQNANGRPKTRSKSLLDSEDINCGEYLMVAADVCEGKTKVMNKIWQNRKTIVFNLDVLPNNEIWLRKSPRRRFRRAYFHKAVENSTSFRFLDKYNLPIFKARINMLNPNWTFPARIPLTMYLLIMGFTSFTVNCSV